MEGKPAEQGRLFTIEEVGQILNGKHRHRSNPSQTLTAQAGCACYDTLLMLRSASKPQRS